MIKRSIWILLLLVASLGLSSCGLITGTGEGQETPAAIVDTQGGSNASASGVISEGNIVPQDFQYLTFASGGEIAEVLVKKGDQVRAGQILARLGDRQQAEANLAAAELEQLSAQQDYDRLLRTANLARANAWLQLIQARSGLISAEKTWNLVDTDDFQRKLDDARVKVDEEEEDLQDAQDEFDNYMDLDEDNPTRKQAEQALEDAQDAYQAAQWALDELTGQYEQAQAAVEQATATLAEAQRTYDFTQSGPDPDQLALAEARLRSAATRLSAANLALEKYDLLAPFDGTILDVNGIPNQLVGADTWVVVIADTSVWYVETNDLTELEVVEVSLGQSALILPDALDELEFSGEVTEIGEVFKVQGGDVLYTVRIRLNEFDPRLRWGMTVEVNFLP
jgi:multidrug efflux pump subunit AcrA (membrane-fusion protein)